MTINRKMKGLVCILGSLLGLQSCSTVPVDSGAAGYRLVVMDTGDLEAILERELKKSGLPSAAVAIARSSSVPLSAARGITVQGGPEVSTDSLYHIGSVTKSMTALLAAQLVEEGLLRYDMTLAEALPGTDMHPGYTTCTLMDLISHKTGIIPFQYTAHEDPSVVQLLWEDLPARYPQSMQAQRKELSSFVLGLDPIQGSGQDPVPVYSNVGYAVLGHIIELAAGMAFEALLEQHILKPLGIQSYKIGGWPRDDYAASEPLGHYPAQNRRIPRKAQEESDQYRLPGWMNPAGGVSLSIDALAAYVEDQLLGLSGQGKLLGPASYTLLHQVILEADAGLMYQTDASGDMLPLGHGWAVVQTSAGPVSISQGSTGTYMAILVLIPELDLALAGLSNAGDASALIEKVMNKASGLSLSL